MKRTKKDRAQLAGILHALKQAQTFLRASTVVVCTTQLPNAYSYYDKTGRGISRINIEIGSDLHCLHVGIDALEKLLNNPDNQA